MTRCALLMLATLLTSCGPARDVAKPVEPALVAEHPFDRIARSLAEANTPAGRFLRGRPTGVAPPREAVAEEFGRLRQEADPLARRYGFEGVEEYMGAYFAMRLWMEYHARQARQKETRENLARDSEKLAAALADPATSPSERERHQLTLDYIRQETARLNEEEVQFAGATNDADRQAYARNRKVFEEAEGNPR